MVSKFGHLSLGQTTYSALLYPQCESVTSKKKTQNQKQTTNQKKKVWKKHDLNSASKRKVAEMRRQRKKKIK